MTGLPAPPVSNAEAIQRFLQTQDLSALRNQPLNFEVSSRVPDYLRCGACAWGWATAGLVTMFVPLYCCPTGKLGVEKYSLEVRLEMDKGAPRSGQQTTQPLRLGLHLGII